jgi:hypothetical protein
MADGLGAITFAELHLLQRVVFAIGAAFFVAAIIAHNVGVGSFGLGLIFLAVSYNFFFDFFLNRNIPLKQGVDPIRYHRERIILILHGCLSFVFAAYCFYSSYSWCARGVLSFPFLHDQIKWTPPL